ncbi:MAG TPA: hypothetical protein VJ349_18325, partial [Stellaceae bacterium]|nr:hypothetical protein [Stellaceae bacterium]
PPRGRPARRLPTSARRGGWCQGRPERIDELLRCYLRAARRPFVEITREVKWRDGAWTMRSISAWIVE